jgi:hypothetical protein
MIELIRRGKDTMSLHGCSVVKPHYYKTNKQTNKTSLLAHHRWKKYFEAHTKNGE